jgi:lipopolysaccharide/colanic/teichoic acid biosynthesis glycosyltransferase
MPPAARSDVLPVPRASMAYLIGKRCLDIGLTLPLGLCAAPLVLLIASASWLRGQPAFYGHARIGQTGATFTCWKLRSMRVDGAAVLAAHLARHPEAAMEWRSRFKLRNDPRVTYLGRFLRQTSLDEVPQLWNVLRGEMSLVGPRPMTAAELEQYGAALWAYFAARPGLTGPWQIAARMGAPQQARVGLDVDYARDMSLARDIGLLWQTLRVVLRRTGY